MNKLFKNITLLVFLIASFSFANIGNSKVSRVITGKAVASFALSKGTSARTAIEEKIYNSHENDTIKKRSHKRRRKVRRPREGR